MQKTKWLILLGLAFWLSFLAVPAKADSVFMSCPSVFNTDNTSLTANIYIGSPPNADCGETQTEQIECDSPGNFRVLVNGQPTDLESCSCDSSTNPGYWRMQVITPITQKYNVTAYTLNATGVSAEYQCIRDRKSFQGQFTVPEFSPLLLPFIIFAALFILRRARKSK